MANQVLKMSKSQIPPIQRKCNECREEEELQMKPLGPTMSPILHKQRKGDYLKTMTGKRTISRLQGNNGYFVQRAVQESVIRGEDQVFSTHCGWIDWPHAGPENSLAIIQEVRRANIGHQFTAEWPGRLHGASLRIEVLSNLSNADVTLQNRVSLGIFQALSNAFESSQLDVEVFSALIPGIGYRSSFSIEDLPSNLIGFYRAILGLDEDGVCERCWCWDVQSSLDRFNHDNDRGALDGYNHDFRPSEYAQGGQWPAIFSSIQPEEEGTHWRIVNSASRNSVTAAGEALGAALRVPRPTIPVRF